MTRVLIVWSAAEHQIIDTRQWERWQAEMKRAGTPTPFAYQIEGRVERLHDDNAQVTQ